MVLISAHPRINMKKMLAGIISCQSDKPAAIVAISFALGIALSQVCNDYIFCSFVFADSLLICASFLSLQRNRHVLAFILGNAAVTLAGLSMALAHRDGIPDNHIHSLISHSAFQLNEPVLFQGCVAEEIEKRGQEYVTTINLRGYMQKDRWIACKGKGILRIASEDNPSSTAPNVSLMPGDRVRGWAVWRTPHNYQNPGSSDIAGMLARRDVFLVGRAKSARLIESIQGDCSSFMTAASNAVRNRVRRSLQPIQREGDNQSSAILASLIIGDYSKLTNSTREIFQNSGTYHVLVVSGLHVAWIAGVLMLLFRWIRLPERIRYLLTALAIIFYAAVIGFQASITRCLWMFILYLVGRLLIRQADPANILFATALLILLVEPDWLFEVGFQLSFLSVLAIAMTAAPAIERYLRPLLDPLRHSGYPDRLFLEPGSWHRRGRKFRVQCELFFEEMTDSLFPAAYGPILCVVRVLSSFALATCGVFLISLSVQIWLEPLLAYYFNRMSWISPLANLALVPFSSLVLSAGVISTIAMNVPWLGAALIQIAGWLASMLLYSAGRITMIEGAWQRCPTPTAIWVELGILLLFLWTFFKWKRFWIPCSYILLLLAFLSLGWHPALIQKQEKALLKITFLDVGEGDSAVISFPNGRHWVLDAGGLRESAHSLDIGEAVVSRYLWHEWITKLDRAILSHSDLDHAGGMPTVLKNFPVSRLDYSPGNEPILRAILEIARRKKARLNLTHSGIEEKAGEATVRIFHPPGQSNPASTNENSIVLGIYYKRFSVLFTGDLERMGESEIMNHPWDLGCVVLKAAHHGSRSGTSYTFLDRTQPRWAVLSVGRYNPYGHPSKEVIARLIKHGARPILTLDQGAITFETDGVGYVVKSYVSGVISRQSSVDSRQ
jgi:competence protein ComEC